MLDQIINKTKAKKIKFEMIRLQDTCQIRSEDNDLQIFEHLVKILFKRKGG